MQSGKIKLLHSQKRLEQAQSGSNVVILEYLSLVYFWYLRNQIEQMIDVRAHTSRSQQRLGIYT